MAQVRSGRSVDPNFRPERKRAFAQTGSFATSSRFKRSQAIASIPSRFKSPTRAAEENRDTAMTLRRKPRAFAVRLIRRASEGPILPPAPRMMKSPSSRRITSWSRGLGVAICSSRCSTDLKLSSCTLGGNGSSLCYSLCIEIYRSLETTTLSHDFFERRWNLDFLVVWAAPSTSPPAIVASLGVFSRFGLSPFQLRP